MDISIIIPSYNEAESLPILIREVVEVCGAHFPEYEILVVDDGSQDNSFEIIQNLNSENNRVKAIRFRRNCGKAAALSAGFKAANGKYVITMDGDLQDNPKEIPDFVHHLERGFDLVSGWKKKRFDPMGKTLPSKLFNRVTRMMSGVKLHDFNCGFKAYRNEVVKSVKIYGELHRYIPVLANWNGFKVGEKVVEHRKRQYGHSKYGWSRLSNGLFDLITLLFLHRYISRPLHLFGFIGLIFNLIGGGILAYFAGVWLVKGSLHIRPLLLGAIAFILLGFQIISLGLLAELIAQKSDLEFPISETLGEVHI